VLGKFAWEEESDSRLDLSGGKSVLLVVSHQLGGLESDLSKMSLMKEFMMCMLSWRFQSRGGLA